MKSVFTKVKSLGTVAKLAICLVIIVLGYFGYKSLFAQTATPTTYTLTTVSRGDIITSVAGTGQVVADVLATIACIIPDEANVAKFCQRENAQYWILNGDIMQV